MIIFQDFLTKWLLVFPQRIPRLVTEEFLPMFGVPESLLSDRGTNLMANVMKELCAGNKKLNTTAYHPQCNGMVERMYRTLKTMLRKHAVKFCTQWAHDSVQLRMVRLCTRAPYKLPISSQLVGLYMTSLDIFSVKSTATKPHGRTFQGESQG